uniref:CAMK/CAMKL protein kinase n=1 Tax=Kwoniella bestiolae CBS 10118 TaxID=1296100 RepID=A0A1B9FZI8_9TREE|nr:CAMK/CAMKL protein kinase [Kwoniella bestiolae CBS 10118]OCF24182.1 CAMK/CAMKL protein kinase [Kwoniella bestiolae CBS 10118]
MVNNLTAQPKLNKPKSKIRLRLGLGSPPQKTQPQPHQQQHLSPNPSPHPLASSTSTSASGVSRTDSRSAFTYDFSSTPSPPHRTEFDTISYNTISPESLIYQNQTTQNDQTISQVQAYESSSTLLTSSEGGNGEYHVEYPSTSNQEGYYESAESVESVPHEEEVNEKYDNGESTLHPAISSITSGTDDIFSLTDQQLSDRFTFISEIGFGNWGSVWLCKPKHIRSSYLLEHHPGGGMGMSENERAIVRLGKKAAVSGGTGAGGKVAVKLVHRSRSATTAARVRALWGEMKIIRSLRHEPHPSIIQFEAFVITPSYALVIMPHLCELIPVCLPPARATPYLRQLASAVGYLHERGITHNDIKPANVLLSHNDIPVLVDFGFAQQWDVGARGSFLSSISWGTPEYLDPIRAKGMPHDERASDVWSLGITMFEILIGRTPFEENEEEQFATPEELVVYYERSKKGRWVGQWSMPEGLENLLRHMIQPDPAYRITAMQAYHHPALQPSAPSVIITPHFVRAAASFDGYDQEPIPAEYTEALAAAGTKEKKKKRKTKKDGAHHHNKDKGTTRHSHRATTPALGESIKQHTSISKAKSTGKGDENDKENVDDDAEKALSKLVIRKRAEEIKDKEDENDDPTPTKILKPAQPLRIKELSLIADKKVVPRTSNSNLTNLSRPSSAAGQSTAQGVLFHATSTSTLKDKRVSALSTTSTVPKSKEEAVLKTMKSLEGTRKLVHAHDKATEAIAAIKRHAPEPPRPKSLDSAVELKKADSVSKKDEERRSLGVERAVLVDVREEEVDIKVKEGNKEPMRPAEPMSPPRDKRSSANRVPTPSPQKIRRAGRKPHAEMDVLRGKVFPASDDESPLSELRDKILVSDQEKLVRFRQVSGGNDMEVLSPSPAPAQKEPGPSTAQNNVRHSVDSYASTSTSVLTRTKSVEALEMDGRLDKMSSWIKSVESIIEDARKAIAEGREPPLPLLSLPKEVAGDEQMKKTFGLTPDKAIPSHLRTCSTQVEPSTPPKWGNSTTMDIKEAEEKVKLANKWLEEQGRKGKKDRPAVSHVLKLFGTEKERPTSGPRSNTPDIAQLVPLKPPATSSTSHTLKGAPSTPALRSSSTRGLTKVPMRRSESNLRNFNTMPVIPSSSFVAGPEYDDDHDSGVGSPRRVMFENLLSTEPGVIRQGDGWGSLSSGKGFMMAVKPSSSMASLRERARALLGDNNHPKGELSKSHGHGSSIGGKLEKRSSKLNLNLHQEKEIPNTRPNTPGAQNVLTLRTVEGQKKGWLNSLKGAMGMGKKMDKVDEA